jgi:aconitate hydratase
MKLAEFTLSRKDPAYVGKAKAVAALEKARLEGAALETLGEGLDKAVAAVRADERFADVASENCGVGSLVYAHKPGDGSAREQAASCQKVLGGWANIAGEYATKRYRSNLINWGMLPFLCKNPEAFANGDWIFVPELRAAVANKADSIAAYVLKNGQAAEIQLSLGQLTDDERRIILSGCLINFYRDSNQN